MCTVGTERVSHIRVAVGAGSQLFNCVADDILRSAFRSLPSTPNAPRSR